MRCDDRKYNKMNKIIQYNAREIKSQQKVCQAGHPQQKRKPNIGLHVHPCLAFEASINFPNSTDISLANPLGRDMINYPP